MKCTRARGRLPALAPVLLAMLLTGCDFFKENTLVGQLFFSDPTFITFTQPRVQAYDADQETAQDVASMPFPLAPAPASAVVDGRIFVLQDGGTQALLFDPGANAWTTLSPLPEARSGAQATVSGTQVFVGTGYTGAGTPSRFVDVLDVTSVTSTWQRIEIPSALDALGDAALSIAGGRLYLVGGRDDLGAFTRDALALDLSTIATGTPQWASLPDVLPAPRALAGAFLDQDHLIVVGGHGGDGVGIGTAVDFDLGQDADLGAFDTLSTTTAYVAPQVVPGTAQVLVMWSRTADTGLQARVDLFSRSTKTFTAGPDYPLALRMSAGAFVDGAFHVFGGLDVIKSRNAINRLQGSSWVAAGSMGYRVHAAFAAVPDPQDPVAYVIGGITVVEEDEGFDPLGN